MMENMGCLFFHILSKHYICGYYGQVYVGKYFSFVTALLHVKGVELNSMKRKDWALDWAFSLYNPHFVLEILYQGSALFNFFRKKCQFHTEKLTCTLGLLPSF